jgi:enamine deaminase RidA (YjgF/YER057c/UK114 family)
MSTKTKGSFLFFCIAISVSAMAQKKEFINPKSLGYSDATVVSGGRTIYISGQVPLSAAGAVVAKGDLKAQTIQVFDNIQRVLTQAGATFADVVKVNTYIVNCQPKDVAVFREVRKSYLSTSQPPASTLVGVTSLVDPDFLIEIEVVAVIQ